MAKSINPFKDKTPPPPPPPPAVAATAKPFVLPPGVKVTGGFPLPAGKMIVQEVDVPSGGQTDIEKAALAAAGFGPGTAVAGSGLIAEHAAAVAAAYAAAEPELPVDPRKPPVKVPETVPVASLDEAKRKEIEAVIGATFGDAAGPGAAPPPEPSASSPEQAQRNAVVEAAIAAAAAPLAKTIAKEVLSETGANPGLTHCPHCTWDLAAADVPEPEHFEKMAFLHAMLGQKAYTKDYPLFGGAIVATFRTLNIKEIDVLYRQVYRERTEGKIVEELDFWEQLNRYRTALQLTRLAVTTPGVDGFLHDLPDGYSLKTNPDATGVWVDPKQEASLGPDATGLPDIFEYLTDGVIKTEALFRLVNSECGRFNRLVSKLEAMADNSDFWKPTGPPS